METAYPWMRQYLNEEFLEYEKQRIIKLSEWRNKFLKAKESTVLEKASFYTIPVELSTTWKGAIANLGNYNCIGLSALYNSPQALLLALLPAKIKQPKYYRLIEIQRPKKINVYNQRLNAVEPMIIIEERNEWEPLESDNVYLYEDISYERNVIQKIFEEKLPIEEHIAQSLQTPIVSAPYVNGSVGGISLASLAWRSSFAKELSKTIQRMVPPEYREFKPPKSAYLGSKFKYQTGIDFHPAERPYVDKNVLSSFCSTSYDGLANKLSFRRSFKGEYSIFSTIISIRGNLTHAWNELMRNFTATDVTLSENIDTLSIEADVELTQLIKAINEDLWAQVVYARQKPANLPEEIDTGLIDLVTRLIEDYDVQLTDIVRSRDTREYFARSLLPPQDNLKRISQSFARSDGQEDVSMNHLDQTRKLIVANFEGILNHPDADFRRFRSGMRRASIKDDPRYLVVQREIVNNPRSSVQEIFESVQSTGRFRDIYNLLGLLDWLHTLGYVSIDRDNRYTWVGSREGLF